MTRDGLVEENLSDKSTVKLSRRTGDVKMERKSHRGKEEYVESPRSAQQSRDAPESGKKRRVQYKNASAQPVKELETDQAHFANDSGKQKNRKNAQRLRTEEKKASEEKLQEREHKTLYTSRGDSRKEETGGTKRPKQKKRLQFVEKETGAADLEKKAEKVVSPEKKKAKAHSNREQVFSQPAEDTGKKKRLHFEGENSTKEPVKTMTGNAARGATAAVRRKLAESEDDNAAVQGVLEVEQNAERSVRLAQASVRSRQRRKNRTARRLERKTDRVEVQKRYRDLLSKDEKLQRSSQIKKQIQKQRIKREYAKAKRMEQSMGTATVGTIDYIKKIGGKVTDFFKENRKVFISIGVLLALMLLIMSSFTSCSSMFIQNVVNYTGAGYMSTDQAIRDADLYYTQLEANLQEKVNRIEADHTGYDRYRYNIDEIGHDPFILISYLSAKYEIFEFDSQVKADLDALFAAQYSLTAESSTETITEKKMVRVGESLGQVVTSGYCSCPICCGQWSGGPTASGVYPQGNHTIAVDAYNPILPFGTKVVMNGVEYTVEDTGNLAQYGVTFDVYYDSHSDALNHGHRTWEAYLSDANGSQEIEVTTTTTESVYSVTLTNRSLTGICQNRMNTQQKALFSAYNETKGNLQMFESPTDINWYYRVSSYYGYRIHPITGANALHNGVDISLAEGTPVAAGLTGKVTTSTYNDSYGNYVVIEDQDGYEIRYAHLSSRSVSTGQQIEKGEEIGKVGSTGNSTGPHLHLELLHNGERLNPLFYFETGDTMPGGDVEYSSEAAKRLVQYALQFQGVPYVWGGYSPSGFDCSGFVSYCLTNSGVLNTGHMDCNGLLARMTVIPESEMQPGDIIFFQGTYATSGASHVGIYIGNGQMVHSGNPNKISDIYSSYFQQHWMCVARW